MNKQTEALRMAKQHIIERKGGRGGAVCYVKSDEDVIKAIDEALEQQEARLVSYAPDKSTCTLNIDGEEVYFNREQPAQEYLTRAQQVIRANNSAQEPVMIEDCNAARQIKEWHEKNTHPAPSWQGLDAVEVSNIFISKEVNGDATQFARAIEQALKEKNS